MCEQKSKTFPLKVRHNFSFGLRTIKISPGKKILNNLAALINQNNLNHVLYPSPP